MKTWNDIITEFKTVQFFDCVPKGICKVHADHVFDEDKSVRWNRERVEENNARYQSEVARLNTEKNKRRDALMEEAYALIQDEVGHDLSKKKARLLWNYAYELGHANGYHEVVAHLQELICLARDLLD